MDGGFKKAGRHLEVSVEAPEQLSKLARALASPVRIQILRALDQRSMNVNELAQALDIPVSSAALAVTVLEEAGLIATEGQPGIRGMRKLCSRQLDSISIDLSPVKTPGESVLTLQMPIGGYSIAGGIQPTCGLLDSHATIGEMDNPAAFYMPGRFGAQLLWFRQGYLEYRFSILDMREISIKWLEVSFEACSEAPMYRDPWKSDIAVSINDVRLGIWTSPCDCGGRRGRLNPDWWSDVSTQYGMLKTWRVDDAGSYLDGAPLGRVTTAQLALDARDHIAVRIEVPGDAEHIGGMNLFGERFGDYQQALILRIGYGLKGEETYKKYGINRS